MPRRIVNVRLWEVVLAFVAVTIAYVVMGVILAHNIHSNHQNKASIQFVERSNCKVRDFLLSSYRLRQRLAQDDKRGSAERRKDRKAARISLKLANEFSNELCPSDSGIKGAK